MNRRIPAVLAMAACLTLSSPTWAQTSNNPAGQSPGSAGQPGQGIPGNRPGVPDNTGSQGNSGTSGTSNSGSTGTGSSGAGSSGAGIGSSGAGSSGAGSSGAGSAGAGSSGTGSNGTGSSGIGSGVGTGSATGSGSDTGTAGQGINRSGLGSAMGGSDARDVQFISQLRTAPDQAPDKLFVHKAATGNLWEVQFGQLVEQRAQDAKVKEVARMVAQDHQQNQDKLRQVAQKLQVEIPTDLPAEKQAKLQLFQSYSPEQLEKCYLGMMRADHAADIITFADHQDMAKDDQLKSYISDTLPKLKAHAKRINEVAATKGFKADALNLTEGDNPNSSSTAGMDMKTRAKTDSSASTATPRD